jgi:hypothetical protein
MLTPYSVSSKPIFPSSVSVVVAASVGVVDPGDNAPKLMPGVFSWEARKLCTVFVLALCVTVLVTPTKLIACTAAVHDWFQYCVVVAEPSVGSATYQSGNVQVHCDVMELDPAHEPPFWKHVYAHVPAPTAAG